LPLTKKNFHFKEHEIIEDLKNPRNEFRQNEFRVTQVSGRKKSIKDALMYDLNIK